MSLPPVIVAALALSALMAAAWLVQQRTGNSGWVDSVWSFSTGAVGVCLALWAWNAHVGGPRALLAAVLAALWSLRLGLHIASRTIGMGDDPRYSQMKKEWGADFPRKLFWFLQIQALCAFLLAMCVYAASANPAPFPEVPDLLGIVVFVVSLSGESLADHQLSRFRAKPENKGKICDQGLWGWSRHPNYFFEWAIWISYALIASSHLTENPWGAVAFAGPVFMYWLLVHVSGIPPLEADMRRSRGEAFERYASRVNAFFPFPPKPDCAAEISQKETP